MKKTKHRGWLKSLKKAENDIRKAIEIIDGVYCETEYQPGDCFPKILNDSLRGLRINCNELKVACNVLNSNIESGIYNTKSIGES